jgi:hypothetical protein
VSADRIKATLGNPAWRLSHLYSIIDKNGDRVRFTQNAIQRAVNQNPAKRKIVLKARQFGISTNEGIVLLDRTIWRSNMTTMIMAHEQDAIRKLFRIPRRAYDFMPKELRPEPGPGGGSMYEMYFPKINSRIYCDLESRGDTILRLHASEVAFMKDPDKLRATLQAVPIDGGEVTLETTPNGMNFFHDMWNDPKSPYAKLFFPWYAFPDYRIRVHEPLEWTVEEREFAKKALRKYGVKITDAQLEFRRLKQSELGPLFIQEYPEDDASCFLASGGAAMDLAKVKSLFDKARKPISDNGWLQVFAKYDRNRNYVIGADTAEGVNSDYSVGMVMDAESREEVAILRGNNWSPYEFAGKLVEVAEMYVTGGRRHPLLGVERNNHGHAVLLELKHHMLYPNLFHRKKGDDLDEEPGWVTDRVTRPIMLDAFIDGVINGTATFHDRATLGECLTLVVDGGKIQAAEGKHDDCVIAGSIAVQMCVSAATLALYDNIGSKIKT